MDEAIRSIPEGAYSTDSGVSALNLPHEIGAGDIFGIGAVQTHTFCRGKGEGEVDTVMSDSRTLTREETARKVAQTQSKQKGP